MENKEASFNSTDKPIYKDFFSKNNFVQGLKIHPTIWREKESKNSFSLIDKETPKKEIPKILQKTFGIENKVLFKTKYKEAISGGGQEWKRITTLHSSSLLALLCFYSVSKERPLSIGDYIFNESFFEVKTVVKDSHKSNMDIVLRGVNKETGEKTVLFLESKFTEYLTCSKKNNISIDAYYDKYNELSLFDKPIKNILFGKNDKGIFIEAENPKKFPIYCEGIKQLLSHYIGVNNYVTKKSAEHETFKYADNEKILLGEIVFDFKEPIRKSSDKLNNYKQVYSELAKRINEHQNQIEILNKVMTYQEIFTDNFIKEENIKQFYKL